MLAWEAGPLVISPVGLAVAAIAIVWVRAGTAPLQAGGPHTCRRWGRRRVCVRRPIRASTSTPPSSRRRRRYYSPGVLASSLLMNWWRASGQTPASPRAPWAGAGLRASLASPSCSLRRRRRSRDVSRQHCSGRTPSRRRTVCSPTRPAGSSSFASCFSLRCRTWCRAHAARSTSGGSSPSAMPGRSSGSRSCSSDLPASSQRSRRCSPGWGSSTVPEESISLGLCGRSRVRSMGARSHCRIVNRPARLSCCSCLPGGWD